MKLISIHIFFSKTLIRAPQHFAGRMESVHTRLDSGGVPCKESCACDTHFKHWRPALQGSAFTLGQYYHAFACLFLPNTLMPFINSQN